MSRSASPPRILVVDDKLDMAETIADGLVDYGFEAVPVGGGRAAVARLKDERFDALVTDLRMPELDGLELLARSLELAPERPVIVMTAYGAIDTAIESIRRGAAHYLTKPFKLEELAIFLRRAFEHSALRREMVVLREAMRKGAQAPLIGRSKGMRAVLDTVARVADADAPILILGETGTGKGLFARAIHQSSHRAPRPFVAVNCAALPEPLLESELFGHVRGAFTGATANRAGLFAEASGGTLFLDEIGDMSLGLQAKLLHVIERRKVRAVGASTERDIDVRVVAATHRNLRALVSRGEFREDLLYRLDVVSFELPALRHRREDLGELIDHFFAVARARHARSPAEQLAPDALSQLCDYAWPGNVRELEHVLERAVLLARGPVIAASELPDIVRGRVTGNAIFSGEVRPMRELQRDYAMWACAQNDGNRSRTAEKLDLDRKTLVRLLDEEPTAPGGK